MANYTEDYLSLPKIRRGSTAAQFLKVSADLRVAEKVQVIYKQRGRVAIVKTLTKAQVHETYLSYWLTQSETFALNQGEYSVQIAFVLPNGFADQSENIERAYANPTNKGEVI